MASILRVRDSKGNIIEIPAVQGPVGPAGKSAYEYAKESGFEGTEELFAERLLSALAPEPESVFDVEIEVSPDGWGGDAESGWSKSVTRAEILESDSPIADIVLGGNITENAKALDAWSCITHITTGAGSVTLYANERAPSDSFKMQLKVVR